MLSIVPAMRTVAAALVLALMTVACGYKGPLYLPKPKPAAEKQAPPAESDEKKKDESGK